MKKEMKQIHEILNRRPTVLFAYLFGSKAKGNSNGRSDWDIAIYFKGPFRKRENWATFNLEALLSRAIGGEVQVTTLNEGLPPVLAFEIVKDGILLLDRNIDVRLDFENRMLRYYHDWQYFLKRQMDSERQLAHRKS
jgi:predicted nucleotidyltransferase